MSREEDAAVACAAYTPADRPGCEQRYLVAHPSGGGGGTLPFGFGRGGRGINEADAIRLEIAGIDQMLADYPGNRRLLAQRKRYMRLLVRVQKKYGLLGLGEVSGSSALVWAFAGYVAYKYLFKGR